MLREAPVDVCPVQVGRDGIYRKIIVALLMVRGFNPPKAIFCRAMQSLQVSGMIKKYVWKQQPSFPLDFQGNILKKTGPAISPSASHPILFPPAQSNRSQKRPFLSCSCTQKHGKTMFGWHFHGIPRYFSIDSVHAKIESQTVFEMVNPSTLSYSLGHSQWWHASMIQNNLEWSRCVRYHLEKIPCLEQTSAKTKNGLGMTQVCIDWTFFEGTNGH